MPQHIAVTNKPRWRRLKATAGFVRRLSLQRHVPAAVEFMRRGLVDLIFPPSCANCAADLEETPATAHGVWLCNHCTEQLQIFSEPMCKRCGAPTSATLSASTGMLSPSSGMADCYRCSGHKLWFDETIALGRYEGELREILLRMKSSEGDSLSLSMARLLFTTRAEKFGSLDVDVVVPIPSHWRRRIVHRTNSAAILAEMMALKLRVPFAEHLLKRLHYTSRQTTLSVSDRWKNVRKAFGVRGGYHLNEAQVLLVDDVLTTGATCSEAAKALRDAGAAKVTIAVLARSI